MRRLPGLKSLKLCLETLLHGAGYGAEIGRLAGMMDAALPGIPIWRTGSESRWPGLAYVVFPGHVGGPDALAQMVQILRGRQTELHPNGT